MTKNRLYQQGFSAVELLITLFIAALFIIGANQLYIYVITNGEDANQRTRASNIGYQYLQSKKPAVAQMCPNASPPVQTFSNVPVSGLTNVTIIVTASCPYTSTATSQDPLRNITKVTVVTRYGSDSKEVTHAIYTYK